MAYIRCINHENYRKEVDFIYNLLLARLFVLCPITAGSAGLLHLDFSCGFCALLERIVHP